MPSGLPSTFQGEHFLSYRCADRNEFVAMVTYLGTCHGHHFAIRVDDLDIFGSEMAMECLQEFHDRREAAYDDFEDEFLFPELQRWFELHTQTRRRDMPNSIAIDLRRALERNPHLVVATQPSKDRS